MKIIILHKQLSKPIFTKISPFIINTLIAPHGITDISHSIETKNLKSFLQLKMQYLIWSQLIVLLKLVLYQMLMFLQFPK